MKNVACFDIGGTFIKYAIISSEGEVLVKGKFPTPNSNCSETVPESMVLKIKELKKDYEIHSVGVCTAGLVDSENGVVTYATNLPGYSGARISEYIKNATGLKAHVENDVNAAAFGEMWKGAAKGTDTFVNVALGTGVGGAIVIDGKVIKGVSGAAGEIGHIIVNEKGMDCGCGCVGCYELYSSTSAFIRAYVNKAKEKGIEVKDINGEEIMERVHSNEALAKEVYDEFLDHVATGLISVTHLLDPGLIVIGGGISAQGQEFFDELNIRFKRRAIKNYADHTKIVQAQLQNDAGIFGACYAALKNE